MRKPKGGSWLNILENIHDPEYDASCPIIAFSQGKRVNVPDFLKIIEKKKLRMVAIQQSIEYYYPHKYAIQITTDSPQWGGLSGCTLEESISWGKVASEGKKVTCYCDATIALPLMTHALNERVNFKREAPDFSWLLDKAP